MHPNIVIYPVETVNFVFGYDLLFCYFIASFDLLHKAKVLVFDIAFLKYDWCDFVL